MDKIHMAIQILKEMAKGKVLTLNNGHRIGMAEDGFIGYVLMAQPGKSEDVSTFSEISFSQLVQFCIDDNIIVIPSLN